MVHEKLTASDVKKIQEEIDHRKLVIRKEALESVKEARAHGDLSENFEYKAAKQYKNKNESRIRYLERMLKNAEIIEDTYAADQVGLNSVVEVYIPEEGLIFRSMMHILSRAEEEYTYEEEPPTYIAYSFNYTKFDKYGNWTSRSRNWTTKEVGPDMEGGSDIYSESSTDHRTITYYE